MESYFTSNLTQITELNTNNHFNMNHNIKSNIYNNNYQEYNEYNNNNNINNNSSQDKNINNDNIITSIPSVTATPIHNDEQYNTPMFIEAENITFCNEYDTYLDLGVNIGLETVAQADVIIHEVTANEIPACNSIIALPECYDAVVVKEKYDDNDLKSDFLSFPDDLLFAEIIDDLAGFNEEEKNDYSQLSYYKSKTYELDTIRNIDQINIEPIIDTSLQFESTIFQDPFMNSSEFLEDIDEVDISIDNQIGIDLNDLSISNDENILYQHHNIQQQSQPQHQLPFPQLQKSKSQSQYFIEPQLLDVNHQIQFSIGAPKPYSMLPPPPSKSRSISTSKLNTNQNQTILSTTNKINNHHHQKKSSLHQLNNNNNNINMTLESTIPPLTPQAIRDRQQALLKWKDKREEKIEEARTLDARQIATAKRERNNGKFAKRKINWVSITDINK